MRDIWRRVWSTENMDQMTSGLRFRLRRAARKIAAQHQHMHEILEDFERALADRSLERLRELYGRYRDALEAHFALEDEVFFPAIHGLQPEQEAELDALSRDHEGFLTDLAGLAERLAVDRLDVFEEAFRQLVRELDRHEQREEVVARSLPDETDGDQGGSENSSSASTSGVESSS